MLEFVLEFSHMKIDMDCRPVCFSQIACRQDPDLHNFLGPSLSHTKYQVFVAAAAILSVRFPFFFLPKLASGIVNFYRFYIPALQKKYSNFQIAQALLKSFDVPGEVEMCSQDGIPSQFLDTAASSSCYEEIYFVVPIKYACHLIATRKLVPKKRKVLVPFSQIHEIIYGSWQHAIKTVWEQREHDLLSDIPEPRTLGFPHEGLFFRHPVAEFSFHFNFTFLVLLPAIKRLYSEHNDNRSFSLRRAVFQISPLQRSGDFMHDYAPLLPRCFRNLIEKCFEQRSHFNFDQRFTVFRFLFGIGVPYEAVEAMWKKMVLNSRQGGPARYKSELEATLRAIHKKHTEYQKDKPFFIGSCQHLVSKEKIDCPYRLNLADIEDMGAATSKCQQECGQKDCHPATSWNPVKACEGVSSFLNKKNQI
jgi:hypothetical protein